MKPAHGHKTKRVILSSGHCCDTLRVTLALYSPSRQRRHVSTFGSRVLHVSFPNKEKSIGLKSAQHSLMQPQNYFTQVQNVEVIEVGSRGTSSEYYQLIRHQRGRMPGAQRLLVLRTSKIWIKSLSFRNKNRPEARQRFVPLYDGLVPELELWVIDVQSAAAGLLPRAAARVNTTKDEKLFLVKGCRMICQFRNIPLSLKHTHSILFFVLSR